MRGFKLGLVIAFYCSKSVLACTTESLYQDLAEFYSKDSVGVSVLVSEQGKVKCTSAIGLADLSLSVPITTEHVFEIGSLTKQFTAVAVLLLAQQGKLSLDDDISEYIAGINSTKGKVTIRHLLSHTSGLVDPINEPEFLATRVQESISLPDLIDRFKNDHWQYVPGERINYTNVGYSMLAHIIEGISGQTYFDFLSSSIFQPLGMQRTYQPEFTVVPNKVSGYTFNGDVPREHDFLNLNWAYGAADLVTNTHDMFVFSQHLMAGKLLNAEHLDILLAPVMLSDEQALGWSFTYNRPRVNGEQIVQASGSTLGNSGHSIYIPSKQMYVVALSNSDGVNGGAWVRPETVVNKIVAKQVGIPLPDFKKTTHSKIQTQQYVGDYELPSKDVRKLTFEKGRYYYQRNDDERFLVVPMENGGFYFADTLSYFYIRNVGKHNQFMDFYYLLSSEGEIAKKM